MSAIEFTELEHDYELIHVCSCSREKMINSVKMLGLEAIKEMIAENKKQEEVLVNSVESHTILVSKILSF